MCAALESVELASDTRFATNAARRANLPAVVERLQGIFDRRAFEEWEPLLVAAGVPVGAINTIDDVVAHPQVQARSVLVDCVHPVAGPTKVVAPVARLSESPGSIRAAAPLLGEHTESILRSRLDLSDADLRGCAGRARSVAPPTRRFDRRSIPRRHDQHHSGRRAARNRVLLAMAAVWAVALPAVVRGHDVSQSESRVVVHGRIVAATLTVNLQDFHALPDVNRNHDGVVSYDEIDAAIPQVYAAVARHFTVHAGTRLPAVSVERYRVHSDTLLDLEMSYVFDADIIGLGIDSSLDRVTQAITATCSV